MSQSVVPFRIPHNATGIDLGDLAIDFQVDTGKIVLTRKPLGDHYTIQVGENSGVFDVHRTWEDESGRKKHETVFAMRRQDIPQLLAELSSLAREFLPFRPLRIDWLAQQEIGVARGLEFATIEDIARVTGKTRRKRITMDEAKFRAQLHIPEYLEEVWDFPDGPFSLFKRGRRIGIGIKVTDQFGRPRLYWIKLRGLTRSNAACGEIVRAALRYAIPPERYGDYSFLQP